MDQINEHLKHVVDTISVITVVATLNQWLPPIAALLTIIWTALRIFEVLSGKTFAERRKTPRKKNAPRPD